jgi:hypothetical protein
MIYKGTYEEEALEQIRRTLWKEYEDAKDKEFYIKQSRKHLYMKVMRTRYNSSPSYRLYEQLYAEALARFLDTVETH